jgi:hypothetical protein
MPELITLMIKVTNLDKESLKDLLRLFLPIFRKVIGAKEIFEIITL